MPALNFKAEFAAAVEAGDKRQSVRAPRKDGRPHCKPGDVLSLYTGMRTRQCRLLGKARVTRIDRIKIEATCMELNGRPLFSILHDRNAPMTDNEFAEADGFESFMDMANWFDQVHGLPFQGVVIHWDHPI
jgi:hypothetical protein